MAETVGFEPTCPCGQLDFESSSLRPLRYVSVKAAELPAVLLYQPVRKKSSLFYSLGDQRFLPKEERCSPCGRTTRWRKPQRSLGPPASSSKIRSSKSALGSSLSRMAEPPFQLQTIGQYMRKGMKNVSVSGRLGFFLREIFCQTGGRGEQKGRGGRKSP